VSRCRKLKDGVGNYLWQPGLATDRPPTVLGRPYVQSENAPNTFTSQLYVAIIGDFKAGYWIVDALQMEVQRLVELFTLKNQVGFKGHKETDGMPVLEEAFSRMILN
jgi:HK97 family phage major capsid protein